MTVETESSRVQYVGNGASVFTVPFRFLSESDLRVIKTIDNVDVVLTYGVDYTVSGVGAQSGGAVTLSSPLVIGARLTIHRVMAATQGTDLRNQGAFYAEVHESAFDKITMLIQQALDGVDRSVKVEASSANTPDQLMTQLSDNVNAAQASASSAAASATSASNSATSASNSATSASNSATSASNSATAAAASAASISLPIPISSGGTGATTAAGARSALGLASDGLFYKADPTTVAFSKTGNGTASIKAGTKIAVGGADVTFTSDTNIAMPTLTAGTDYAIWVKDDATIQATTNFTSAPGAGNWRKIGGFHYAPGGNASEQAGGDTTAQINAYSFWDLKFRPACPDPRGMTLVANSFWSDIYLLGVDHHINGTSKYNVTIADGVSPPKIPAKFGGNGLKFYSTLNWWEAAEVMQSWGKRLPTYDEFAALAYGTTEATSSSGIDVPTTGVNGIGAINDWNKFTSKWGVIQSSGCLLQWGSEFGGGASASGWTANTGGRGSTLQMENAVYLGGAWNYEWQAGSRCSSWGSGPSHSSHYIGARGVADHLVID